MKMKAWWIPQVPGKSFEVEVRSLVEAKRLLIVLANYDLFQFENRIKPDYCNAGGLMVFEDGEWTDFCDADNRNIDEISLEECAAIEADPLYIQPIAGEVLQPQEVGE